MNRLQRLVLGALLALTVGATAAQNQVDPCAGKVIVTRVLPIRFRSVNEAVQIVDGLLGPCGAYRAPKAVRAITIEDEPRNVQRIVGAITGWDVPPPTIELTVSLILATREPAKTTGIAGEIRGVSELLAGLTQWTHFDKLGTATIKIVEGADGQVDLGGGYSVAFRVAAVDVSQAVIRLDPITLRKAPDPQEETGSTLREPKSLLSWAYDLQEGRMQIVAAPSRAKDRGLILALEGWTDIGGPPTTEERRAAKEKAGGP